MRFTRCEVADGKIVEEWTPHWRDEHGVVHVMGTHTNTRAFTECGIVAGTRKDGTDWTYCYEHIRDAPTCLSCIGEAIRPELSFVAYEEEGLAMINTKALSKINMPDD